MPPGQRPASATKDAELETLLKLLGDNFNVRTVQHLKTHAINAYVLAKPRWQAVDVAAYSSCTGSVAT
jgi:hypothetical protein